MDEGRERGRNSQEGHQPLEPLHPLHPLNWKHHNRGDGRSPAEQVTDEVGKRLPGFTKNRDGTPTGNTVTVFEEGQSGRNARYRLDDGTERPQQWQETADAIRNGDSRKSSQIMAESYTPGVLKGYLGTAIHRPDLREEMERENGEKFTIMDTHEHGEECDAGVHMSERISVAEGYRTALHEMIGHCGPSDVMDQAQQDRMYSEVARTVPYQTMKDWIGEHGGTRFANSYVEHTGLKESGGPNGLEVRDDSGQNLVERNEHTGELHISEEAIGRRKPGSRFIEEAVAFKVLTGPAQAREHEQRVKQWELGEEDKGTDGTINGTVEWMKRVYGDIHAVYRHKMSREEFQQQHEGVLGHEEEGSLHGAAHTAVHSARAHGKAPTIHDVDAMGFEGIRERMAQGRTGRFQESGMDRSM